MGTPELRQAAAVALVVTVAAACVGTGARPLPPGASCAATGARLQPASGAYFGINLDWNHDSPGQYAKRIGHSPAL
jgi:hypothetical protein